LSFQRPQDSFIFNGLLTLFSAKKGPSMAQKVQVLLVDDLDGGEAEETVSFGIDGATYEIDLSGENAAKLRAALEPFIKAAARHRRSVVLPAASSAAR